MKDKSIELANDISIVQKFEELGVTDELLVKKLKDIIKARPKRVSAYDIIRAIELVAKIKGIIKEGVDAHAYITNIYSLSDEEIDQRLKMLSEEIKDVIEEDRKDTTDTIS